MTQQDTYNNRTFGLALKVWSEYHLAIKEWLSGISFQPGGRTLGKYLVVFATPELAFARAAEIAPLNQNNPQLPMFSFFLCSVSFNRERWFVPSFEDVWWEKIQVGNEWRIVPKSLPYDLSYSITLWHKHEYEAEYADWDILSRFRPLSYVYANGASSPIHIESVSDASELEPGSASERKLRRTYSIRVEGWLPLPYRQVSRIEQIQSTMTDVDFTDITQDQWELLINDPNAVFDDEDLQKLHDMLWTTGDIKYAFQDMTRQEISPKVQSSEIDETTMSAAYLTTPEPRISVSFHDQSKITLGGNMKL